jgi:uncharacterized protein
MSVHTPALDPLNLATYQSWLCVVLHDVSAVHWLACMRVLRLLRAVEREAGVALPLTLLVAPEIDGAPFAPPAYLRGLHRLRDQGHELALQGLSQRDDGEVVRLDPYHARARLLRGQAWAAQRQLSLRGLVAPTWRLDAGAWQALAEVGFDYTCTRDRVVALPHGQSLQAPNLAFSGGPAWRRGLSMLGRSARTWLHGDAALWRFELHPHDADHRDVRRCWSGLIAAALRERRPLRLAQAAELARAHALRPVAAPHRACSTR